MADSHPRANLNGNPNGDIIIQAFHSATVGKRLESVNGEPEQFLRGLNGSTHAALDLSETSGLEIVSRTDSLKLRVDGNEETPELNYDELYQECKMSQRELIKVQKKCIKDSKHKELNESAIGSEDGELHYSSVADVEKVVATAYKFLDTKPNPGKQKEDGRFASLARYIRKGFRCFRRNAENMQCFLAFIPDASGYGSVLSGGLSIILQAAATYETLDELICGVLDDIRRITEFRGYEALEAARNNPEFHRKMSSLYAMILDALRLVTKRVFKGSLRKVAHAITHTKGDGGDLVILRNKMKEGAQDVHKQVESLMYLILHKGYKDIKYIRAFLEQTFGDIEKFRSEVNSNLLHNFTGIQKLLETPPKDLEVRLSRSDAISCIQEALTSVLEKSETQHGEFATRRSQSPNLGPRYRKKPKVDIEQLLYSKGYPRTMVQDDCAELCRSGNISGRNRDRQRIRDLTNHPRMQSFVMLDSSMVLMVKGGLGSQDRTLSPTSYSLAKLVTALQLAQQQTHSVVSLAFFCGQHRDDGYSGCRELMITLILQLIDQYREFSTELLGYCERYLGRSDIQGLCDIFEDLCFELPESIILYCVLDGLGFFSFPEKRLTETRDVIQRLLTLSRGIVKRPNARIKLLCATPAGCPDIEAVFADWDIIELHNNTTGPSWHEGDWEHSLLAANVASQSTLDQY